MRPGAVVFDLDDTLADTSGTVLGAAHRDSVAALIEGGLNATFDAALAALHEIRRADPGAPFLRALVLRFGAEEPEKCHDRAREVFFGSHPDAIRLVPGAREVLAALRDRGIPLYLVTFGVPEAQEGKIDTLGIRDLFVEIHVVPLDRGSNKTEVLQKILENAGLSPDRVWIVGDRPPGEIRDGNSLGMRTVRVRSGEFAALEPAGPEEVAHVTITDLRELLPLWP